MKKEPHAFISRRAALAGAAASIAYVTALRPGPASAITTRISGIRTIDQYVHAIGSAHRLNKAAIVDIAADWCDYCRVIDERVMQDPQVLALLPDFAVIKVDVTAADDDARTLLGQLGIDGPPTIFIVDTKTGKEFPSTRSVGPFTPENLVMRMNSVSRIFAGRSGR